MLPSPELTELREAVRASFPDTCTIQGRTETNTKGSVEIAYATRSSNVPCRVMLSNRQSAEDPVGEKPTGVTRFNLTVPYDQDVRMTDRVIHATLTYEVVGVSANHSYRTANRAEIVLVE